MASASNNHQHDSPPPPPRPPPPPPSIDYMKYLLSHPIQGSMNKDATYTYIHMQQPRDADLFEDFCKDKLPADDIYVPPHLQPINPEDEDDVVPDQHAAFGIQKATQSDREPAWKDLGLADLMHQGPSASSSLANGLAGAGGGRSGRGGGGGRRRRGYGAAGRAYKGMPR
ncbi:Apc13p protein-domain-containing protein [Cercophora scortea]|uniref:Apc13p protein-domain-containing protein n=1 Tax=Cercophora scortea TaxID=314031 RepID=A0AAE0MDW4_9PEZI|nr:Apc13p protein-domain-containing protein [Cercophora scortea]